MEYDSSIRKIFLEKFIIIGLQTELTKSHKVNYKIITKHWKSFNYILNKIPNRKRSSNWVKYGLTYKENDKYFYLSSIIKDKILDYPANMIEKNIYPGNYLYFEHLGNMLDISKTINNIFNVSIPENNINIKKKNENGLIFLEKYDYEFKWNKPDSKIKILIPTIN